MLDRCMRKDSLSCDPSHITLGLQSRVIWLGWQLEESFLTHWSTIRFSFTTSLNPLVVLIWDVWFCFNKQINKDKHLFATSIDHSQNALVATFIRINVVYLALIHGSYWKVHSTHCIFTTKYRHPLSHCLRL